LIDDDRKMSEMLTEYLAGEGFKVAHAFSGLEGELALSNAKFDAVILDIMLPDISGIDVLRRVRRTSAIPIIMLTAKGDDVDRVIGLEMGADDYLTKPYFPRELLARLRAILRRNARIEQPLSDNIMLSDLVLSPAQREVTWKGAAVELTTTEFNMLATLMRAGHSVVTKDDLSTIVLGRRREAYDRSVDVHVGNLRRKISVTTANQCEIDTVRGIGYRLRVIQ
jgi:two-component system OmpR family response regulator